MLELGSEAGFLRQFLPEVITSEVFEPPGVRLIADACDLPFQDKSLDAIVMTNVFHHLPDVGRFILEAGRCVRPGGKIVQGVLFHPSGSLVDKGVVVNKLITTANL